MGLKAGIEIEELSVHNACNQKNGKYIYFDVYYAGMNIGKVDLESNEVKLHKEEGIFIYEENIESKLLNSLLSIAEPSVYNIYSNENGFLKLVSIKNA